MQGQLAKFLVQAMSKCLGQHRLERKPEVLRHLIVGHVAELEGSLTGKGREYGESPELQTYTSSLVCEHDGVCQPNEQTIVTIALVLVTHGWNVSLGGRRKAGFGLTCLLKAYAGSVL